MLPEYCLTEGMEKVTAISRWSTAFVLKSLPFASNVSRRIMDICYAEQTPVNLKNVEENHEFMEAYIK
jgi:hypothetical protein